jgi:hypothetical protein
VIASPTHDAQILQLKENGAARPPFGAVGPSGACEDDLAAVSMARAEM